jgi:hypothetical protein
MYQALGKLEQNASQRAFFLLFWHKPFLRKKSFTNKLSFPKKV